MLIVPNVTQYYQNPVITCDWDVNTNDKTVILFLDDQFSASYEVSGAGKVVKREERDYISYKASAAGWLSVSIIDVTEKTKGPYKCQVKIQVPHTSFSKDWFSKSAKLHLQSKFFSLFTWLCIPFNFTTCPLIEIICMIELMRDMNT